MHARTAGPTGPTTKTTGNAHTPTSNGRGSTAAISVAYHRQMLPAATVLHGYGDIMTRATQSFTELRSAMNSLAARKPELFTTPETGKPAFMRGPCSSSGYCG